MGELLTDEVRSWIGREAIYTAPEELGRAAIRYFAQAVGDDDPLYTDDAHAQRHGHPSVIAPPTLVCETNQFVAATTDEHGYTGHTWDLPVDGCRLVRGGNAYTFERPVLPTDRVTVCWTISDITEKTSSAGAPMLVVISVATYTNQDGELLATNRETLIYHQR
jgi:acyl dehydratase